MHEHSQQPGDGCVRQSGAYPQKVRRRKGRLPLDEDLILSWADEHFRVHGTWPRRTSGAVIGRETENWYAIDKSLRYGYRGLLAHSSLPILLEQRRGVEHFLHKPDLTIEKILELADQHYAIHGAYPSGDSGVIGGSPKDTWMAVDNALRAGNRGVPGGTSLARLLQDERGRRHIRYLPALSGRDILAWADEHRQRTGEWPTAKSGIIHAASKETWSAVNAALKFGYRGLPGGSSLARLRYQQRGVRPKCVAWVHDIDEIAAWMRAHAALHGRYPSVSSGVVEDFHAVTWRAIESALRVGHRGLPGGSSLAKLKRQLIDEGKLPELKTISATATWT